MKIFTKGSTEILGLLATSQLHVLQKCFAEKSCKKEGSYHEMYCGSGGIYYDNSLGCQPHLAVGPWIKERIVSIIKQHANLEAAG